MDGPARTTTHLLRLSELLDTSPVNSSSNRHCILIDRNSRFLYSRTLPKNRVFQVSLLYCRKWSTAVERQATTAKKIKACLSLPITRSVIRASVKGLAHLLHLRESPQHLPLPSDGCHLHLPPYPDGDPSRAANRKNRAEGFAPLGLVGSHGYVRRRSIHLRGVFCLSVECLSVDCLSVDCLID